MQKPVKIKHIYKNECLECKYSTIWDMAELIICIKWFCILRFSNETSNGLLEIKPDKQACKLFKKIT